MPNLGAMLSARMACRINDDDLVVLRFWDPRILLGLPSALDAEQRRHFFAPVAEWTAWEPRRRQYYTITPPPDAAPVARLVAVPMALTLAQRKQLMFYDQEALYERILAHWEETCPDAIDGIEPAMLREIAIAATTRCASYGIHTADDQVLFTGLMMAVSPSFDDHPAVQRGLRDGAIPPTSAWTAWSTGFPARCGNRSAKRSGMRPFLNTRPCVAWPRGAHMMNLTDIGEQIKSTTQALAKADAELKWELAASAADVAGLVDPTPASDLVGAGLAIRKGDWLGAGMSVVSMVPYLGDAIAKPAKGVRAAKRINELARPSPNLAPS